MKEFFLNHICTTPPYTVADCEHQYAWFATIAVAFLIILVIGLGSAWVFWRTGKLV